MGTTHFHYIHEMEDIFEYMKLKVHVYITQSLSLIMSHEMIFVTIWLNKIHTIPYTTLEETQQYFEFYEGKVPRV